MSVSKLSDAQLVLLSSAAQHPQGAIKLGLKGAALALCITKQGLAAIGVEAQATTFASRGTKVSSCKRDLPTLA